MKKTIKEQIEFIEFIKNDVFNTKSAKEMLTEVIESLQILEELKAEDET